MLAAKKVTTSAGSMAMTHPCKNTVLVVCEGLGDEESARVLCEFCESVIAADGGPLVSFHDWHRMKGYENGARKVLTDWNIQHRKEVKHIHILTQTSGIASMGATVAALVLPFLSTYTDSASFREAAINSGVIFGGGTL